MGQPGKRAPTVEICESDKNFEPLAMRQHVIGPYPFDPNLLAQGIPPDDRVTFQENIYGPLEGTPLPPGPGTRSGCCTTGTRRGCSAGRISSDGSTRARTPRPGGRTQCIQSRQHRRTVGRHRHL